ncbi:hypothetical protein V2J09_014257 [Rumex salicifolius]
MFDPLFEDELQNLILMAQLPPPPPQQPAKIINRSAFNPFMKGSRSFQKKDSKSPSMNKRMIEFARKDWIKKTEMREPEKQRSLKHVMNERMRRERERQSFSDLHSILPPGVRNEKISIIQSAATEIQKLENLKEELQKKNSRMAERVAREGGGGEGKRTAKIRVRVDNPTSGIDSLQEVLKCLNHMGLSPKRIGFELSKQELSAVIEFDNQIEVTEVEDVIRTTLAEVDKWLSNESNLYTR